MKTLFASVLFALSSGAIASQSMPVIFTGDYPVSIYEDTLPKNSIVCKHKDTVIALTRYAGNNDQRSFNALANQSLENKECLIMEEDLRVNVDAMVPVPTNNGLLFVVRLSKIFWAGANYLPKTAEHTIKWRERAGYD